MLFTATIWLQVLFLLVNTRVRAVASIDPLQIQQFSKNTTVGTAAFQQAAPNVFFTDARNFTTSESVGYSPSMSKGSNISVAPLTDFIRYGVAASNPPLELDCKWSFRASVQSSEARSESCESCVISERDLLRLSRMPSQIQDRSQQRTKANPNPPLPQSTPSAPASQTAKASTQSPPPWPPSSPPSSQNTASAP